MPARPRKTAGAVTVERVISYMRSMYNPIRNLTPATLANKIERFESGYLNELAQLMAKVQQRDDTLASVAPKREKAVSRHGWEIVQFDDSPEAAAQKEVLEQFYGDITAISAVDGNCVGGVNLLIRQMMSAVGMRYACHEIVWQPKPTGLTAEFRHVPLWFFENATGTLRYLTSAGSSIGIDMPEGEWLVHRGDGLMVPCVVCWLYKNMPLKDWVAYCERHGMPGLHGVTSATEGSTEWNALVTALENFGVDFSMVTNEGARIDKIDTSASGELPYPKLVERMDRAMAALWRGADLSTMSAGAGEGTGASLQGDEADILEDDDADSISESLNRQVDPWVLRYAIGTDQVLAGIKLNLGTRQDVTQDMAVDNFLISAGAPISLNDLLERYGRPQPAPEEVLATRAIPQFGAPSLPNISRQAPPSARPRLSRGSRAPHRRAPPPRAPSTPGRTRGLLPLAGQASPSGGPPAVVPAAPALLPSSEHQAELRGQARYIARRLDAASDAALRDALAADFTPLRERLAYVLDLDEPDFQIAALRNLRGELPNLLLSLNADPASARALEESMAAAVLNGFAEAAETRMEPAPA